MIRRRLIETSDTAEEKIEYITSTIQKNVLISLIVGSVVIFLLLLFCFIRYRNGRSVAIMSRIEFRKRKAEFKRVLEPEEVEERKNASIARRSRGCESPDGDSSMETNKTAPSSDVETGEFHISELQESVNAGGIEVSPLHSTSGEKIKYLQDYSYRGDERCKGQQSPNRNPRLEVGHECIELHAGPIK